MNSIFTFYQVEPHGSFLEDEAPLFELDPAGLQLVPCHQNLYFFNEADLFQGEKSHQYAARIRQQHFQEMEQYELFLQRKGRRPLYDLYACFQPFNEATKAFFPFIKSLRKRLKPGDVILNLWDRSAYFAGLLAAFFPDQQIITTWTGNKDVLGYKGFFHWLKEEPNLKVLFCDLDKPLPIQDNAISLVVGLDAFHRFDQSLLMRELLRITHDEAAIIFPHVHLSNSEPEPFFERGCKQIHGSDYDAFFQKMAQRHPRKGYVFGEPYLFWQNDGERNQQIPLRSNPHTTDYNALICILPNSWEEDLSAFSMEDIEDIGSCRILLNQLLHIDLHQQRVRIDRSKMDGTAGHLLDRHPVFVKRMADADGYVLPEAVVQVLHLAQYGFTLDEISQQLGLSPGELSSDLKPLEQAGIIQVLPLSENFFRLQHYISTQYYIIPQKEQTIVSLWQKAQGWFADQSLVLDGSDESEFSFEEADEVVQMICDRLQAGGIRKGDHVLLYGGLHVEALLTFWACMQLGIVVVPVHEHVNLPSLTAIQTEVQAKLIFCAGTDIEMVQQVAGNAEIVLWDDEDGELELNYFSDWLEEEGDGGGEAISIDHSDIAVVIFTSGSTGKPKGVPLSQGHLYRSGRLITETFHWTEKDRFLALGGLGYMSGLRNSCIAPLLSGTTVVVPDSAASQHAFGIAEAIDQHRVSILAANPALYRQFVQYKDRLGRQLRSLTCVMCTGSHLTEALIEEFESAFQQRILNYYGLTETTGICTAVSPFAADVPPQSIGQPIGSVAQIVDEMGEVVPAATEGELRVFSKNLMTGYLNQSAETERMMLNGWLYTGDIACMDDRNHIQLRGRKREIVKTATEELIYLNEIEAAARKLPWVKAAAALSFVKHDAERVALFILCAEDRIAETGTILIREHLEALLGKSRLPQLIRLKSEFPYGANGKILKKQLIHELQNS